MNIKALTDVGKIRKINEDSYRTFTSKKYTYAMVADGMGGHQAGEVASGMAVDIIGKYIDQNMSDDLDKFQAMEVLRQGFLHANADIYEYSCENDSAMGMGTTATLCMIRNDALIFAHVGDSRAYLIKDDIKQLTRDHSYVQELVKLGEITPEEAKRHPRRNYITRAMGVEPMLKVDTGVKPYEGETLLICSDGLFGEIEDSELLEIINQNGVEKGVEKLVELANERGGADNMTAVVVEGEDI